MQPPHSILVVEDSVVISLLTGRVIEQALPGCQIVRAQSCFEAKLLLRLYDFKLCILDIHLPDGCGLDLLPSILAQNPQAGIVVLTADGSTEHRDRSTAFGIQHFLTKPVRAQALRKAALEILQPDVPQQEPLFTANLAGLSVLDVLQLKCLTRVSTQLQISTNGPELQLGTVNLEKGEIVHAEVRDESLRPLHQGEAALEEILHWQNGQIRETQTASTPKRTIEVPWQGLLLSSAQKIDEVAARNDLALDSPAPVRHTCRSPARGVALAPLAPTPSSDRHCPLSPA